MRTFYKGCIGLVVVSGDENALLDRRGRVGGWPRRQRAGDRGRHRRGRYTRDGAGNPANAATAYSPKVITVGLGETVTWRNTDSLFHTITSGPSTGQAGTADCLFDGERCNRAKSFQHTFDEAGTFDYHCTPPG